MNFNKKDVTRDCCAILVEVLKMRFHENPSGGSRPGVCVDTKRNDKSNSDFRCTERLLNCCWYFHEQIICIFEQKYFAHICS